jgi:hypothetical protein
MRGFLRVVYEELLMRSLVIPFQSERNLVDPDVRDGLFMLLGHYSTIQKLLAQVLEDFYKNPGAGYPSGKVAFLIRSIDHGYLTIEIDGTV